MAATEAPSRKAKKLAKGGTHSMEPPAAIIGQPEERTDSPAALSKAGQPSPASEEMGTINARPEPSSVDINNEDIPMRNSFSAPAPFSVAPLETPQHASSVAPPP